MSAHSPTIRLGVTLLLGSAGALINLFNIPLFFGVDFLFGGALALAPAILYGPCHGLLAGGLAALPTLFHWHHPYAALVFCAEGLAMGWLVRRRREAVVEAELLYWSVLGVPLVYVFYRWVLELPLPGVWVVMAKQPLNAVVNAVLCSLWLYASGMETRLNPQVPRTWPMRAYLTHLLAFVAITPVLVGTVAFGNWYFGHVQTEATDTVARLGLAAHDQVELWLANHLTAVAGVARAANKHQMSAGGLQEALEIAYTSVPGFHNVHVADTTATAIAFYPTHNASGTPNIGLNFADRPYYHQARQATAPFATGAFRGRGGTTEIIVNMVAPIRGPEGEFRGYVVGAADLQGLQRLAAATAAARSGDVAVLDAAGQVVVSTSGRWQGLDPWAVRNLGEVRPAAGQNVHMVLPEASSALAAWQLGHFIWDQPEANSGWRIVALMPIARSADRLFTTYAMTMALALVFLAAAVLLNRRISAWLAGSLEELAALAHSNLARGTGARWPLTARVTEVDALARSLQAAADELHQSLMERERAQQERSRLLADEQAARLETELVRRRLAVLAEASELLTASGNEAGAMATLARLAVPGLADWCAIDVAEPGHGVTRLAVVHAAQARADRGAPPPPAGPAPDPAPAVAQVLRTGSAVLHQALPDPALLAAGPGGGDLPALQELGIKSAVVVPIRAQGEILGAITFASARAAGHYEPQQVSLAEELARGAALALANARLYREAQKAARYDSLTGLPNRAFLMERLAQALAGDGPADSACAILFLDLDNFKMVNDSLGHQAGDHLLVATAERLSRCVPAGATAGRVGGDEFMVVLEQVNGPGDALDLAERVNAAMQAPVLVGGREVLATFSIGAALSSPGHAHPDDLLRDVDLALHAAKNGGKARWCLFEPTMQALRERQQRLQEDLRRALDRNEMRVHYQPQVQLDTGLILGVEALARWTHPEMAAIEPGEFIPLAEETGLIIPLGKRVLESACHQVREWQVRDPRTAGMKLSVNLSPRQFQDPDLVGAVAAILRRTGLKPSSLCLEITESTVMQDLDAARTTMVKLKELGVRLALDDFGTGYSSLSYLKAFPVDILKIDKSFVRGLEPMAIDVGILHAVMALAAALDLEVIAEGIETDEQLRLLRSLRCVGGQGYLFAPALPAADVEALLARQPFAAPPGSASAAM